MDHQHTGRILKKIVGLNPSPKIVAEEAWLLNKHPDFFFSAVK